MNGSNLIRGKLVGSKRVNTRLNRTNPNNDNATLQSSESQPLLKLDFNERADFPSQWLNDTNLKLESLWHYPDKSELTQKLAQKNNVETSQIFCSNGGDEAIALLMRIVRETAKLILPLPAFSQYTSGISSWNLPAQLVAPKNDLTLDVPQLLETAKQQSNSVVILTSPNNPTGESIRKDDLVSLLYITKETNSWVFLDEAYIEFSDQESAVELLPRFSNLVILRTFSKAFGLAGLRLGYLIGSPILIKEFSKRSIPFNIPTPSLQLAARALEDDVQNEAQDFISQIKRNRATLQKWLTQQNIQTINADGNFLFLKLTKKRATLLSSALKNRGIFVRTFSESYLSQCVRITIPYQLERLEVELQLALTPELICFDMDGVLIDTSSSYDESIKATVLHFTEEDVNDEDIRLLRSSGGFNNDWVLTQKLIEKLGVNIPLKAVTRQFQEFYLGKNFDGFVSNEKKLVTDSLSKQLTEKKITKAIVTGRPRLEAKSGQTFVDWDDCILVSEEDVTQGKPSPEGINSIKKSFNVTRSWMVGDTPDDIQAALGSGSIAIGISSTIDTTRALYNAGADIVLKSVNDIEELL